MQTINGLIQTTRGLMQNKNGQYKSAKVSIGQQCDRYFTQIVLVFILALYFFFGLQHISEFMTADDHYWIQERIPQYWQAIRDGKWKKTRINDKPGVTLALISGIGLLKENDPASYRIKTDENLTSFETNRTEKINYLFRLPILVFNGLFLFLFYFLIKKITNSKISILSVTFIYLSPIILGISQITNPDSLLWTFSGGALLSFLVYLETGLRRFAWLFGILLGFSFLSKYVAVILVPAAFILIFTKYIFQLSEQRFYRIDPNKIIHDIYSYLIAIAISMVTFAIFMPAAIIKPKHLFFGTIGYPGAENVSYAIIIFLLLVLADAYFFSGKVINKIFRFFARFWGAAARLFFALLFIISSFIIVNWSLEQPILNLDHIPFDARQRELFTFGANIFEKVNLEFLPIIFSLTILSLFFILYIWLSYAIKPKKYAFLVFAMSLFTALYIAASIKAGLLITIRYGIMIYPPLLILAAIGVHDFFSQKIFKKIPFYAIIFFIIAANVFDLWKIKPFYFNYTNDLLPKNKIITGAWGYGGYEAAQYINSLPNAENLTIWSDYHGVCEFFIGKCITKYRFDRLSYPVDYYVLTRRGRIRYNFSSGNGTYRGRTIDAYKYYDRPDPVWHLYIDSRPENYVKIFKTSE